MRIRWLKIPLIVAVAFAFTILADRVEPRHPAFSHKVTAPGVLIVLAICMLLRIDFLGHSFILNYLILAIDTLIWSGLFLLLMKLYKRLSRR